MGYSREKLFPDKVSIVPALAVIFAFGAFSEQVELQNGSILTGDIVDENSRILRLRDGTDTLSISQSEIVKADRDSSVSVQDVAAALGNAESTGRSDVLSERAKNAFDRGEWVQAGRLFEQSAAVEASGPHPRKTVMLARWTWAGGAYYRAKEYPRSLKMYRNALDVSTSLSSKEDVAENHVNIAEVLKASGRREDALEWYNRALQLPHTRGRDDLMVRINKSIGGIFESWGLTGRALEYYTAAQAVAVRYSMDAQAAQLFGRIGAIHEMRGDYVKALASYTQALYRNRRLESEYAAALDLLHIGITAGRLGENNRSASALNEGVTTIEEILLSSRSKGEAVDFRLLGEAYRRLSIAGIKSGHFGQAFSAIQKGNLIDRIEGTPSLLRKLPSLEELRSLVGKPTAVLALGSVEHPEKPFVLVTSDTVHAFIESDSGVVSELMSSYGAEIRENYRKKTVVANESDEGADVSTVRRYFSPTSEFVKIVDYLQLKPGPETTDAQTEIEAKLITFLFGRITPLLEHQSKLLIVVEPRLRSLPFGRFKGGESATGLDIAFVGQLSDTLFR